MKISSWTVIEALMQQNGINKQQLAAIAGVGPSAVTKWASGGAIRIQSVYRIAKHFGIDPVMIIQAEMEDVLPKVNESVADWRLRALDAERKLKHLREAIKSFNEVVARMEGAL